MDMETIIAIVRSEEANEIRQAIVIAVLAALIVIPSVMYLAKRFGRVSPVFCLFAALAFVLMATKPTVVVDDYLANDQSVWATNSLGNVTGVTLKWAKTRLDLPNTTPLYISRSPTNETNWVQIDTTTVGGSPRTITMTNALMYKFMLWHEWVPPSPVHTNGVWLGTVLEHPKSGKCGRYLIINGQILNDGKVIAP